MKQVFVLVAVVFFSTISAIWAENSNLLTNGGLEMPVLDGVKTSFLDPEDWMIYAGPGTAKVDEKIGISTKVKRSGKQSLFVRSVGVSGAFQGLWINVPVQEKEKYEFELYVLNNAERPMHGNIRGEMSIEWKDFAGKELSRSIGPYWSKSNSKKSWKRYRIRERSPAGAAQARLVITAYEGTSADTESSFYIDDIVFKEK